MELDGDRLKVTTTGEQLDPHGNYLLHIYYPADLTVSKRPRTSYQIEIHFAVVNHLYLLFSLVKLVET